MTALWIILSQWKETLLLNFSNVFYGASHPAISFHCIQEKADISKANSFKTWQLTPKQSRRINITTHQRGNMYFWFFWFSRPFNATQRWQECQALNVTGANWISTQLSSNSQLPVVSDHCRQPLTFHPSISFQAFTAPRQTFGLLCVLTQVVESEMRGEGEKGGRGLGSALSEMFSAVCNPPPPPG